MGFIQFLFGKKEKFQEIKTSVTCPVCKKGKLVKQKTSEYCDSCGEEFFPSTNKEIKNYKKQEEEYNGDDLVKESIELKAEVRNVKARFELWRSEANNEFYFRLVAANNKIIGQSEGYKRKANALAGIKSVKLNAGRAKIVEVK